MSADTRNSNKDIGVPSADIAVPSGGATTGTQLGWIMTSIKKLEESHDGVKTTLNSLVTISQSPSNPAPEDKNPPRSTSGGDNGGSDMERRIDRLEDKVDSIDATLIGIHKSLSNFESKFSDFDVKLERLGDRFENRLDRIGDKIDTGMGGVIEKLNAHKESFEKDIGHQKTALQNSIDKSSSDVLAKMSESKTDTIKWVVGLLLSIPAICWVVFQIIKATGHP